MSADNRGGSAVCDMTMLANAIAATDWLDIIGDDALTPKRGGGGGGGGAMDGEKDKEGGWGGVGDIEVEAVEHRSIATPLEHSGDIATAAAAVMDVADELGTFDAIVSESEGERRVKVGGSQRDRPTLEIC